jgi:glycosyltransferase involved in cell wall biosynthesis/GT2 family glycosyltransferase
MKLDFLRSGRREPLSWQGDRGRVPADGAAGPVDVVVPVWGAPAELARCVASLRSHSDFGRHRLVLALDGPQPAATEELVADLLAETPAPGADAAGVMVLAGAERQGFVASVNRGMAVSQRDVVLLNGDTQVTAGWLDKLQRAAYSAPEIATVTPFSNSATICSLPRFLAANALPAGWDVAAFGRLVEQRSLRLYPRLPTGVGVCLYIKRKALAALGLFDQSSFGLGYGEESEFCMRASKAGYAHVLDDATFIYHEGHRSFGTARRARVAAAHRTLRRLHPEYLPAIASFVRQDPLRPLRERVIAGLLPARRTPPAGAPLRVLHVVHGWPPWNHAGTELYAAWLVRHQAAYRQVTVYSRIADAARSRGDALELLDQGARVRLMVHNFTERNPFTRNALHDGLLAADFARLLDEERPELIHVHHLAGHAATLLAAARRRRLPVLYQLQDWWTPCARANLFDVRRQLCSGPGIGKCSACLPLTGLPPAPLLNRALHACRAVLTRRALRAADAYVAGSRFIVESYNRLGLLGPRDDVHLLSYGVELAPRKVRPDNPHQPSPEHPAPLHFGFIGSLLPHKGAHLAAAAFAGVDPRQARLSIWGDPAADPAYTREVAAAAGQGPVELRGRFEDTRKAETLASLDALIVPSLGLESFGLVAREALQRGVPVLAARRGALAELFAEGDGGIFFDPESAGELANWIARLIAAPDLLHQWQSRMPAVKGAGEHADEIEEVYARLLARRGGRRGG